MTSREEEGGVGDDELEGHSPLRRMKTLPPPPLKVPPKPSESVNNRMLRRRASIIQRRDVVIEAAHTSTGAVTTSTSRSTWDDDDNDGETAETAFALRLVAESLAPAGPAPAVLPRTPKGLPPPPLPKGVQHVPKPAAPVSAAVLPRAPKGLPPPPLSKGVQHVPKPAAPVSAAVLPSVPKGLPPPPLPKGVQHVPKPAAPVSAAVLPRAPKGLPPPPLPKGVQHVQKPSAAVLPSVPKGLPPPPLPKGVQHVPKPAAPSAALPSVPKGLPPPPLPSGVQAALAAAPAAVAELPSAAPVDTSATVQDLEQPSGHPRRKIAPLSCVVAGEPCAQPALVAKWIERGLAKVPVHHDKEGGLHQDDGEEDEKPTVQFTVVTTPPSGIQLASLRASHIIVFCFAPAYPQSRLTLAQWSRALGFSAVVVENSGDQQSSKQCLGGPVFHVVATQCNLLFHPRVHEAHCDTWRKASITSRKRTDVGGRKGSQQHLLATVPATSESLLDLHRDHFGPLTPSRVTEVAVLSTAASSPPSSSIGAGESHGQPLVLPRYHCLCDRALTWLLSLHGSKGIELATGIAHHHESDMDVRGIPTQEAIARAFLDCFSAEDLDVGTSPHKVEPEGEKKGDKKETQQRGGEETKEALPIPPLGFHRLVLAMDGDVHWLHTRRRVQTASKEEENKDAVDAEEEEDHRLKALPQEQDQTHVFLEQVFTKQMDNIRRLSQWRYQYRPAEWMVLSSVNTTGVRISSKAAGGVSLPPPPLAGAGSTTAYCSRRTGSITRTIPLELQQLSGCQGVKRELDGNKCKIDEQSSLDQLADLRLGRGEAAAEKDLALIMERYQQLCQDEYEPTRRRWLELAGQKEKNRVEGPRLEQQREDLLQRQSVAELWPKEEACLDRTIAKVNAEISVLEAELSELLDVRKAYERAPEENQQLTRAYVEQWKSNKGIKEDILAVDRTLTALLGQLHSARAEHVEPKKNRWQLLEQRLDVCTEELTQAQKALLEAKASVCAAQLAIDHHHTGHLLGGCSSSSKHETNLAVLEEQKQLGNSTDDAPCGKRGKGTGNLASKMYRSTVQGSVARLTAQLQLFTSTKAEWHTTVAVGLKRSQCGADFAVASPPQGITGIMKPETKGHDHGVVSSDYRKRYRTIARDEHHQRHRIHLTWFHGLERLHQGQAMLLAGEQLAIAARQGLSIALKKIEGK